MSFRHETCDLEKRFHSAYAKAREGAVVDQPNGTANCWRDATAGVNYTVLSNVNGFLASFHEGQDGRLRHIEFDELPALVQRNVRQMMTVHG